MFQTAQNLIPQEWSGTFEVLSAPISWLPAWHIAMVNFAWYGTSFTESLLKRVLVLLPMLLLIAAMWCTMLSLYTLPFRSARGRFLTAMLAGWWDAGRAIWFFWAGMVRLGVVLLGSKAIPPCGLGVVPGYTVAGVIQAPERVLGHGIALLRKRATQAQGVLIHFAKCCDPTMFHGRIRCVWPKVRRDNGSGNYCCQALPVHDRKLP